MDQGFASLTTGAFQLRGCAKDSVGDIDPELKIYHKCKGKNVEIKLIIPQQWIGKEYNISDVINLQGNFPDQKDQSSWPSAVSKCGGAAAAAAGGPGGGGAAGGGGEADK